MGEALAEVTKLIVELLSPVLETFEVEDAMEDIPELVEDVGDGDVVIEEVLLAEVDELAEPVELGESVEDEDERLVDTETELGDEIVDADTELVEGVSSSGSEVLVDWSPSSIEVLVGRSVGKSPSSIEVLVGRSPSSIDVVVGRSVGSSPSSMEVVVILSSSLIVEVGPSSSPSLIVMLEPPSSASVDEELALDVVCEPEDAVSVLELATAGEDELADGVVVVVVVIGAIELDLPGMRLRWTSLLSLGDRDPIEVLK